MGKGKSGRGERVAGGKEREEGKEGPEIETRECQKKERVRACGRRVRVCMHERPWARGDVIARRSGRADRGARACWEALVGWGGRSGRSTRADAGPTREQLGASCSSEKEPTYRSLPSSHRHLPQYRPRSPTPPTPALVRSLCSFFLFPENHLCPGQESVLGKAIGRRPVVAHLVLLHGTLTYSVGPRPRVWQMPLVPRQDAKRDWEKERKGWEGRAGER